MVALGITIYIFQPHPKRPISESLSFATKQALRNGPALSPLQTMTSFLSDKNLQCNQILSGTDIGQESALFSTPMY
jgi:hypothetical protein